VAEERTVILLQEVLVALAAKEPEALAEEVLSTHKQAAQDPPVVMALWWYWNDTTQCNMRYLIIRQNYVINVILVDYEATPDWVYPHPHDLVIADPDGHMHIGDWYEESEGIFYRPINAKPTDLPEELQ
jgi:hypothetical protein